jgi:hypothetical protein
MLISDIASEILLIESINPNQTSIPAISFFVRSRIGTVNNLLCEDFKINPTTLEITKDNGNNIGQDAVAVIKQMYKIYDMQIQINNNMNGLAKDGILSVEDNFGGTNITRVNRNEISKTWASLKKEEIAILNNLVGAYKIKRSISVAVHGDDSIGALWGDPGVLLSLRDV